ncbi:MAG: hypothetical protein WCK90_04225 [archaeon]
MAFKSIGYCSGEHSSRDSSTSGNSSRVEGQLVARVGSARQGRPSNSARGEHVERLIGLDNGVLGYNLDGKMCLMRAKKNDRGFDSYLAMPFTKGVTERESGRTMLILGSTAHHGEAMVGQFEGMVWTPESKDEEKMYGNSIRWINVGDLRSGFVGLDYNPAAHTNAGVAISVRDVQFLANSLVEFGYDPRKRLFLLRPPYIVESEDGKKLRESGYETLRDFIRYDGGNVQ